MSPDDLALLRDYTHRGSQAAFTLLVERHINLVYSVALRQVRSPHLAEEVAQSVFVDLARQASRLRPGTHLAAWLHTTSRRAAIDVVRRESRRQAHEALATEFNDMKTPSAEWTALEPILDEAVEALSAQDRSAILLRFFENKNFREIGAHLGVSDDTAQKRVSRALEKLRASFAGRGIAVGAATLASQLTTQAVQVAPAGLATAIAATPAVSALVAGQAAASGSQVLALGTAQKVAAGALAAVLVGAAAWEAVAFFRQRSEIATIAVRSTGVAADLTALRRERDAAAGQLRTSQEEIARLAAIPEVELDAEVEAWLARVTRLRDLAAQRPEQTLPEFALLTEKDWFDAARDAKFATEDDLRQQLGNLRTAARWRTAPLLRDAVRQFVDAHQGLLPDGMAQLAPFASQALSRNILERYQMLARGKLVDVSPDEWLLEERTSFDEAQDSRLFVARWKAGIVPFSEIRAPDLRIALERYRAAHDGQLPAAPAHLLSYFPRPPSPLALKAWLEKPAEDFTAELRKLLPES